MTSKEYRRLIQSMSSRLIKKHFPGLKMAGITEYLIQDCAREIAKNVHARMYGANVDGVASPIWQTVNDTKPNVDALELLKENDNEKVTTA